LFANDGVMTEGPLYRYVSNASSDFLTYLHHLNANLLLALVALHVAAILFYGLAKHENLVWPMVTGYKADAALSRADAARGGPLWLAAVLAAACAGLVWWLITRL
jgi:cytochrome b